MKTRYESKKPNYQTASHTSQPPMNSTAVFEWETFRPLANYSDAKLLPVFQRISRDIIERPYHYDAHHAVNANGQLFVPSLTRARNDAPPQRVSGVAVYKQNHGTGHAIRQMIYTDLLIDTMAREGNREGKAAAEMINAHPEMKSLLKLAAYCKRIGRTLDHEHDDEGRPRIYSKRSAEMFALIAK